MKIPVVEPEDPPSDPPSIRSDSRELVLRQLREVEARAQEAIGELSGAFERRIQALEEELAAKEEELGRARVREHRQSQDREDDLDRKLRQLRAADDELAARIAALAAPKLEASGAIGAKAVTDLVEASRKRRELVRDVVVGLALAAVVVWQLFGHTLTAETPPAPAPTHPPPARGPGYGGRE